jgi:hypothetical protein
LDFRLPEQEFRTSGEVFLFMGFLLIRKSKTCSESYRRIENPKLSHRITLSGLASTLGGIVKPICFAVRRIQVGHLQAIALRCHTKRDTRMERQLTMRLPADLAAKLERSAKRLKRKRSEVVREALEQYLDTEPEVRPVERVRDLLGSVASGLPDLGQRHREYLTRRLRRGR